MICMDTRLHHGNHNPFSCILIHSLSYSRNLAIGQEHKCHIELNTKTLTHQQIQAIEDRCNECIRQHLSMTPRWLEPDSEELEDVCIYSTCT